MPGAEPAENGGEAEVISQVEATTARPAKAVAVELKTSLAMDARNGTASRRAMA